MPTSMTTAPSFIQSPFSISAFPVPTTRMSAFFTFTEETNPVSASLWTFSEFSYRLLMAPVLEEMWRKKEIKRRGGVGGGGGGGDTSAGRSAVLEWQQVTVAWFHMRRSCMGAPTILLRPITTAVLPDTETPAHMGPTSSFSRHILISRLLIEPFNRI